MMFIIFAYVDPISGVLILQIIASGVIGVLVFFRDFVKKIFCRIFRIKLEDESNDEDSGEHPIQ